MGRASGAPTSQQTLVFAGSVFLSVAKCHNLSNGITSHSREQISYFGPDGLLRRHEYRVDLLGGAPGLNYAHEFREVDGIMVAMKRRVYSFDADKRKIAEPVLVAIDIHEIAFG